MLIAVGATRELPLTCEVLNYEAPFGVGYLVAQLTSKETFTEAAAPADFRIDAGMEAEGDNLPALARAAVEQFVREGTQLKAPTTDSELLRARAACFVSLKTLDGELRGCIGTIEPAQETLAAEVIANAISAATRDPRFSAVPPENWEPPLLCRLCFPQLNPRG